MGRYVGQALVHSMVAAVVVEALALMWREDDPRRRIRLRLLALGAPLLPLLDFVAPVRREEWFEERWALLSGRHWSELSVLGVEPYALFVGGLSALGIALFLVDVARHRRLHVPLESMHLDGAPILVAGSAAPFLLCRGARVIVSRGAISLLDGAELRAAIAHEQAHVRSHDGALRWLLTAARALQIFNPVVQIQVRAIARDEERRADDAVGDRLALASAILKLHRAAPSPGSAAIEERCRRLWRPRAAEPPPFPGLRLCAAGASLVALLFFVV